MSMESATLRVYEKLRHSLTAITGVTSFQSLACRALVMAKLEDYSLAAVQIAEDGSLLGFNDYDLQIETHKGRTKEYQSSERGSMLIARLLNLLHIFLGEALTLRLLRNAWPDATFDVRNSGTGEKYDR